MTPPWKTMELATFPLCSGSTIAFLQNGSAFLSVCATLKKPWREERNVHGEVIPHESCWSRGWTMWASFFCDHNRPDSPLCHRATHMTPMQDWLFLQNVYSSQQSIKIQTENGLDGHFVDVLMDACCSHIYREVSPFWSPSVFVVKIIFRL